ncbi:unnamed protein product [Angiostrongylus costaricensis]|uniref:CULLIN_2 domain-containing protein n=1 Tax=Angiostrongylus costaricensis TaxID=334426 RepID=A0A158PIC2_ANGCS|nr:unnamed protein product [Angiostrongylus costaricensis]
MSRSTGFLLAGLPNVFVRLLFSLEDPAGKMPIISTFLLFLLPWTRSEAEDITFLYLEISMELIEAMKDTDADEGELHQAGISMILAKNIVYYGEDQQELQKLYDVYLLNKSDIVKNAFIDNYVHKKRLEYVRERVDRNLAYFLTHDQINKVKNVVEEKFEAATSSENLIHAVKDELAKQLSLPVKKSEHHLRLILIRARSRTLKEAETSLRLPRAPKGHHIEELEQMDREPPPFIDVATTLRSCACGYLIVLAIYLNTLLVGGYGGKEGKIDAFAIFTLQRTTDTDNEDGANGYFRNLSTVQKSSHFRFRGAPLLVTMTRNRTLKSARMSIRLPRAPKGHHIEELDQMEKFLAEDDEQGK